MTEKNQHSPSSIPRLLISILVAAAFVVILNETTLAVALHALIQEFNITPDTAQWLITGFMLTMGTLIPMTGYIIQRFSLRSVYIAALSLFLAGTILAILSPSFIILLFARIIQASGTALVIPLLMTTIMLTVPLEKRGSIFGVVTIVIAVAPALGPTFSGFIIEHTTWRWIFGSMVPLVLLALVIGITQIENFQEPKPSRLDVLSVIYAAFGFSMSVYGLVGLGEFVHGVPIDRIAILVVGLLILALFISRQKKLTLLEQEGGDNPPVPLLNFSPVKNSTFSSSVLILLISFSTLFGYILVIPLFAQEVLGLSVVHTGLISLPGGLTMAFLGPLIGRMYDKVGPRPLIIPGSCALLISMLLFLALNPSTSFWYLVVGSVILHIGVSLIMTPLMTHALATVPPELSSHGSALINTFQQIMGAVGGAGFVAILSVGSSLSQESSPILKMVDGTHLVFAIGAIIAALSVILCLILKLELPSTDSETEKEVH